MAPARRVAVRTRAKILWFWAIFCLLGGFEEGRERRLGRFENGRVGKGLVNR